MTDHRGTLRVVDGAWHLRLNDWYHLTHPLSSDHKENLCHYFWTSVAAVMYWFFKVGTWWGVAPVFYALFGVLLAFVGYCFWLWPEATTASLLLLLAIIVALIAVAGIIFVATSYESFDKRTQRIVAVVFAPLWIPIFMIAGIVIGIVEGAKWIDRQMYIRFRKSFWSWFFTSHKFWIINPWLITSVMGLATFTAIFGWETVWSVLSPLLGFAAILAGVILAAVIIVALGFLVGSFLKEKWQDWQFNRRLARNRNRKVEAESTLYYSDLSDEEDQPAAPVEPRGTSSYRVIWQFLVATKHRFCPYIEIIRT